MTTTTEPNIGPRRAKVLALYREGMTPRRIAGRMRISTQAVYEHLTALRELGLIEPKQSA